jgi:hypothetical protein
MMIFGCEALAVPAARRRPARMIIKEVQSFFKGSPPAV